MRYRIVWLSLCLMVQAALAGSNDDAEALRFVALDVGEGESLLLQQGSDAILIDTGHMGMTRRVLQRLQAYGVESLDAVILTNVRPERAGGYFLLRDHYPDLTVYYNGHELPENISPDSSRWIQQGLQQDPHAVVIRQGESIQWHTVSINVLWPEQIRGHDINRNSLVLEIGHAGRKILVMSNVGQEIESELLSRRLLPQQVDVLVVAYHGSATSSSIAFLSHVQPRYAVISVNHDNVRGFPHPAVIARLERLPTTVLRTDVQGDVCLSIEVKETRACSVP